MPIKQVDPMPITVHFKKSIIRTDGALCVARITQCGAELNLTEAQAISLGKQLLERFANDLLPNEVMP